METPRLEDQIVPTEWTDVDTARLEEALICDTILREAGFEDKTELD